MCGTAHRKKYKVETEIESANRDFTSPSCMQ
jgi:hypothetical protein